MISFITNNLNLLYNKFTNLFTTEEDALKTLLTNFFTDYNDIIEENKIFFTIHIQKTKQIETVEPSYFHSKFFLYNRNDTNNKDYTKNKKKYNYKYKYTFSPENYKQEKKLYYVNLFIPYDLNYDCMILKKYYYCIDLVDNNIQSLLKEDNVKIRDYTEITLKSVITEIVDTVILSK
jgi:hypothetical protein